MCRMSFKSLLLGMVLALAGAYFIPWQSVQWGRIDLRPVKTMTVVGSAQNQVTNEIAEFYAGVESYGDKKDQVIEKVNTEAGKIVTALKEFGIPEADIKTQNISVYQQQESYYDSSGSQRTRPGQWSANNSVQIILRDVNQVDALSALLNSTGATNVYGPNFRLDEPAGAGGELLAEALDDARAKAEKLASAQGMKLGKIISITEGYSDNTIYPLRDGYGGGGAESMPGSSAVTGTVTVVYEVR